jgi:hypothetical protein
LVRLTATGANLNAIVVLLGSWRGSVAGSPLVVVPVLVGLLGCLGAAAARQRWAAVALLPLGVLWLLVNGKLEGPVLISLDDRHGLTLSDLLAVAGFALAGWVLTRPAA